MPTTHIHTLMRYSCHWSCRYCLPSILTMPPTQHCDRTPSLPCCPLLCYHCYTAVTATAASECPLLLFPPPPCGEPIQHTLQDPPPPLVLALTCTLMYVCLYASMQVFVTKVGEYDWGQVVAPSWALPVGAVVVSALGVAIPLALKPGSTPSTPWSTARSTTTRWPPSGAGATSQPWPPPASSSRGRGSREGGPTGRERETTTTRIMYK